MKYLVDWENYKSSESVTTPSRPSLLRSSSLDWMLMCVTNGRWSWESRHMFSEEYEFDDDIDLIEREQPDRDKHADVLRECDEKNAKLKEDFREEYERILETQRKEKAELKAVKSRKKK